MSGTGLEPYRKGPRPVRVAWAIDPDHAIDSVGSLILLGEDTPADLVIYSDLERIEDRWMGGDGAILYYAGKRTRYVNRRGIVIRLLPIEAPDDDDEAAAGVFAWSDFVISAGARPSSLAATSTSLYRATCRTRLLSGKSALPAFVPLGGRVGDTWEQGPHTGEFLQVDLPAAYASILGTIRYGSWWREISPGSRLEPGTVALAHADVRIPSWCRIAAGEPPGRGLGPLPVRSRRHLGIWEQVLRHFREDVYPTDTRIRGIWTTDELAAAERMGAGVRIDRLWANLSLDSEIPFAPWWAAIQEARSLPGYAGQLGKGMGNALVGSLVLRRENVVRVSWTGRRRRMISEPGPRGNQPRYPALFEAVTARCRARLLDDVLSRAGRPAFWHTDGCWIERRDLPNVAAGWRTKSTATGIDFFDAATYAYSDGVTTTYVMAGERRSRAAITFDELWISRQRDPARSTRATPHLEPAA